MTIIQPIDVEIFQSESKWWTNIAIPRAMPLAWMTQSHAIYIVSTEKVLIVVKVTMLSLLVKSTV